MSVPPSSIWDGVPRYKAKFLDAYMGVIQGLTVAGCNFNDDAEGHEELFDSSHYFSDGVVNTVTSSEIFLAELVYRKLREIIKSGAGVDLSDAPERFRTPDSHCCRPDKAKEIVDKINAGEGIGVAIDLELRPDIERLSVGDWLTLLQLLGVIKKDDKKKLGLYSSGLQDVRNAIVHRGHIADFEEYAKAFVAVGKVMLTRTL